MCAWLHPWIQILQWPDFTCNILSDILTYITSCTWLKDAHSSALFFFFSSFGGGVGQSTWHIGHCLAYYKQPRMIDDDNCGAIGGMRGNRSTRRKPTPMPLYPTEIPYYLNWAWTWAAAVGNRRLTAWGMSRPSSKLLIKYIEIKWFSSPSWCWNMHIIHCTRVIYFWMRMSLSSSH
jgi:hypothetical protein